MFKKHFLLLITISLVFASIITHSQQWKIIDNISNGTSLNSYSGKQLRSTIWQAITGISKDKVQSDKGFMYIIAQTRKKINSVYGSEPQDQNSTIDLRINGANPASNASSILLTLKEPAYLTLGVYDLLGREILKIADGFYAVGSFTLPVVANDLQSGNYIIKLNSPKEQKFCYLLIIK